MLETTKSRLRVLSGLGLSLPTNALRITNQCAATPCLIPRIPFLQITFVHPPRAIAIHNFALLSINYPPYLRCVLWLRKISPGKDECNPTPQENLLIRPFPPACDQTIAHTLINLVYYHVCEYCPTVGEQSRYYMISRKTKMTASAANYRPRGSVQHQSRLVLVLRQIFRVAVSDFCSIDPGMYLSVAKKK